MAPLLACRWTVELIVEIRANLTHRQGAGSRSRTCGAAQPVTRSGWDPPVPPAPAAPGGLYGTVGICPAFSCASRAALSPASCVGSSFDLNVPAAGAVPGDGVEVAAGVVVVVVLVCALAAPPNSEAPMTPPAIIDPRIADPTSAFNLTFILVSLLPDRNRSGSAPTVRPGPPRRLRTPLQQAGPGLTRRSEPRGPVAWGGLKRVEPPEAPLKAPCKKETSPSRGRVVPRAKGGPMTAQNRTDRPAPIPQSYGDILEKKGFAHVATIGPSGMPQSTPV